MRWKAKEQNKNTNWHIVFAWKFRKTEDNKIVWMEYLERRYKIHMSGGSYIYKTLD